MEQSVDPAPAPEGTRSDLSHPNDDLHFHYALRFGTQILAHMLDSLVRVSRRVGSANFVRIANTQMGHSSRKQLRAPGKT